jgi:hypothetical protein
MGSKAGWIIGGRGLWVVLVLLLTNVAWAQQQQLEPLLAQGVRLLEEQPEEASHLLRQVYEVDPGYSSVDVGSVALAFGRSLQLGGQTRQARRIWEAGLRAQVQEHDASPATPVDPQLLDAYLEVIHQTGARADPALLSTAFMAMLTGDSEGLSAESQKALVRHLCLTALLTQSDEGGSLLGWGGGAGPRAVTMGGAASWPLRGGGGTTRARPLKSTSGWSRT